MSKKLKTFRVTAITYGKIVETRIVNAYSQEEAEGDAFYNGKVVDKWEDPDDCSYESEELTPIDKDLAKAFMEDPDNVTLDEAKGITDDAAKLLCKFEGDDLFLNGLFELSDHSAESLSKYQGNLYLDGLTEISDPAADSLSNHQGKSSLWSVIEEHKGELWLNGLTKLSDTAAESLSKHLSLIHI